MFKLYEKDELLYDGNVEQIANILCVPKSEVYNAKNTGEFINGKYRVVEVVDKKSNTEIKNHLFREDGGRAYNYKKGYSNRYKDASCVRFTPL